MESLLQPWRWSAVAARLVGFAGGGRPARPATDPSPLATGGPERFRELKFVRRVHRLRTLGLGLGFFAVASVLALQQASASWWVILGINGFVWPHIALWIAQRAPHPAAIERRSLAVDSALGGMWIAVMAFNVLPSALLLTMLSVDKMTAGGKRLLLRTSIVLVAACVATSAALGFPIRFETPMSVVYASLPLLALYPLAISIVTHSLAAQVARTNRRLVKVGRTDELTGLANRREGFAVAEAELARHRRTGRPAMLVVLDIDHFKRINDRHGHPVGDDVLRRVAAVLAECTRTTDTPARYGGDEFMLVLPEANLDALDEMAQRMRARLKASVAEIDPQLRCTLSMGAASAHADMADVEDWIQQADAALYRAKAGGRDCVVAAPTLIGAV